MKPRFDLSPLDEKISKSCSSGGPPELTTFFPFISVGDHHLIIPVHSLDMWTAILLSMSLASTALAAPSESSPLHFRDVEQRLAGTHLSLVTLDHTLTCPISNLSSECDSDCNLAPLRADLCYRDLGRSLFDRDGQVTRSIPPWVHLQPHRRGPSAPLLPARELL